LAKTNPYFDFLLEQFEPLGEITVRAMFGGHGFYCNGLFFAIVANNAVFLKADEETRPDFATRGLKAFRPFEDKKGVMQYYEAPAEMFEDPEALKQWAGGAVGAAARAQTKRKPKGKRRV
jgi:DNA transformation protein